MDWNRDLTLDEALADPMIAAALRADRVDPRQFEALLRSTAHRLAPAKPDPRRASAPAPAPRAATPHSFAAEDQLRFRRRPAAEGCTAW